MGPSLLLGQPRSKSRYYRRQVHVRLHFIYRFLTLYCFLSRSRRLWRQGVNPPIASAHRDQIVHTWKRHQAAPHQSKHQRTSWGCCGQSQTRPWHDSSGVVTLARIHVLDAKQQKANLTTPGCVKRALNGGVACVNVLKKQNKKNFPLGVPIPSVPVHPPTSLCSCLTQQGGAATLGAEYWR